MNLIHLPYWLVGDKKIYNQFEANKAAFQDNGPSYRVVFLEDVYDQLNWQQEPGESWEQLCLERALYLRHKWKKLKLCFSAGRDSGHIMRVFEKNNIPIDELVLPYSQRDPLRLHEHTNYVRPIAEQLCRQNPKMTIREICIDQTWFSELYNNNADWLIGSAAIQRGMTFTGYNWKKIIETDPDHASESTGYIFGLEKPRIRLIDNNFVFQILDTDFQHFGQHIINAEWFYWAPEQPRIFLKQCWMLVNYLEQHYPGASADFVAKFQNTRSGYYDEFCLSVGRGPAMIWTCGDGVQKTGNSYQWHVQQTIMSAKNEKWASFNEWQSNITDLKKNYSHFYNQGDPLLGTIGIGGKPYIIKQQNNSG
jgi:hypothetical protein